MMNEFFAGIEVLEQQLDQELGNIEWKRFDAGKPIDVLIDEILRPHDEIEEDFDASIQKYGALEAVATERRGADAKAVQRCDAPCSFVTQNLEAYKASHFRRRKAAGIM